MYDAAVLDIMLPKLDGFAVLSRMRAAGITTPVLVLTARGGLDDRVAALDRGADDYLAADTRAASGDPSCERPTPVVRALATALATAPAHRSTIRHARASSSPRACR
jgi:CheY-like chemotaxis protein